MCMYSRAQEQHSVTQDNEEEGGGQSTEQQQWHACMHHTAAPPSTAAQGVAFFLSLLECPAPLLALSHSFPNNLWCAASQRQRTFIFASPSLCLCNHNTDFTGRGFPAWRRASRVRRTHPAPTAPQHACPPARPSGRRAPRQHSYRECRCARTARAPLLVCPA